MNSKKGFASALVLIITLTAIGVGGYAYQAKKHAVRKIDGEKEYETTARTSPVVQMEAQPNQQQETVGKSDAAKEFLVNLMARTRGTNVSVVPKVKQVYKKDGSKLVSKVTSGYAVSPGLEGNVDALLSSKGFKSDMHNSGDATFHSSSAYISDTVICINSAERINPKGDVTLCDDSPKSPCYTKTELFCSALDQ